MKISAFQPLLLALTLCAVSLLVACSSGDEHFDSAAYETDIESWRTERLSRLKGPLGYLNLAGLFWLDQQKTTFGSGIDNDLVFPAVGAPRIGVFLLDDSGVTMVPEAGVDVRHEDSQVGSIVMSDDTTEAPVTITHRSLAWIVIQRDGRFAVRLRDYDHPAIASFPPLEYFELDPELRVPATYRAYEQPKVVNVDTVIEGLGWQPESPGILEFNIDGTMHSLEAYASGDDLFFVFGDRTSGRETYPAGRFLYASWPADGEQTILDFNKAYNPPCAFNDFATCPVASPRNRMPVPILAGERFNPDAHAVPDEFEH